MRDHSAVVYLGILAFAGSVGAGCSGGAPPPGEGRQIALDIAPLQLAGVSDVCYGLTITNGAVQTVMSQGHICASQYGAGGSVSYVAPCDAAPNAATNTVSLVIEQICSGAACADTVTTPPALAADTWSNPCPASAPCTQVAECKENADVPVTFDLTVARDAQQGFFDIAVNFDEVFCSAKVDCEYPDGDEVELLFNASGDRDSSIVMAFACTAGPGAGATTLHMDDVTLTCPDGSGGQVVTSYDPAPAALGNQILPAVGVGPLFQLMVSAGVEQLPGLDKLYWAVIFGVNLPDAVGCVIETRFTASSGDNGLDWTLPGYSYPVIDVVIPVGADADDPSVVTCGGDNSSGLDDDTGVIETSYAPGSDQGTSDGFDNCANDVAGEVDFCDDTQPATGADLSLEKSVDDITPNVGDTVVFTLTVTNDGPEDATNVTVTDLLSGGYALVGHDADATGTFYDPDTGAWVVGTVPSGSSVTLHITVRVNPTGPYSNRAEITKADQADPDSTVANGDPTEDDFAAAATLPVAGSGADLSLEKTADTTSPGVGSPVRFTLTVTNDGPGAATGVAVTDQLPPGYAFMGDNAAASGTFYDPDTGVWTIGSIPAGESVSLILSTEATGQGGTINTAEITAANEADSDSEPGNGVTGEDDYASAATTPLGATACPCWQSTDLAQVIAQLTSVQYSQALGFGTSSTTLSSSGWAFTAVASDNDTDSCSWSYTEPGQPPVDVAVDDLTPAELAACEGDIEAYAP